MLRRELAEREQQLQARERESQALYAAQQSYQETQQHLEGALETIQNIRNSLSYRLGFGLTWPARKLYDGFIAPFHRFPDNGKLLGKMSLYLLRHPIKSLQLLNWERIRNAYITFFRNPGIAGDVVDHYARILHNEPLSQDKASKPSPSGVREAAQLIDQTDADPPGQKVSIITINYNGKKHLSGLLASLLNQEYENFEIILVDNGSTDGSVDWVRTHYPQVKLVALRENVGFAEANNIGVEVADGRYWCLVNNDMEVAPDWLRRMVEILQGSTQVGAVGPKIRFWKPFAQIHIQILDRKGTIRCDENALRASLTQYPKYFFGPEWTRKTEGNACWAQLDGRGILNIAVCEGQDLISLPLQTDHPEVAVEIRSPQLSEVHRVQLRQGGLPRVNLDFRQARREGRLPYLINNAASEVDEQGNVRDRGFGKIDDGRFDQREVVSALCGGAMLIRPEALQGKPIFGSEFFAYFEDTDLSLRIREAGYRLLYAPDAVVYHKHASTSRENSAFFRFYVHRNRLLFLALHFPESQWRSVLAQEKDQLNHLYHYYASASVSEEEREFGKCIPTIFSDWERLLPRIQSGQFFQRKASFPRIGVYNNFWNTLGGGEHHAGVIAMALQRYGPVDLISEKEFSIQELERQFELDLKYCRKRILSPEALHHDPQCTGAYDLFINSTFGSDLHCHAKWAYYVVSFPFRLAGRDPAFLDSYQGFWANSQYTASWIKRWWHKEGEVLYPSVAIPELPFSSIRKEKRILHVGRFFRSGHNKKQLELARAFTELIDSGALSRDWRLTFVGQVHWEQADYLEAVREAARGYPVDIQTDVPLSTLRSLFERSAIYWHGTGLGEEIDQRPELFEHFGITTVEAMSYACVPIVIDAGGQPETVRAGKDGFLFRDLEELKQYTERCARWFETDRPTFEQLSRCAYERARSFSRQAEIEGVHRLLAQDAVPFHQKASLL